MSPPPLCPPIPFPLGRVPCDFSLCHLLGDSLLLGWRWGQSCAALLMWHLHFTSLPLQDSVAAAP